eukprot:Gb_18150 [translate_table: standard]
MDAAQSPNGAEGNAKLSDFLGNMGVELGPNMKKKEEYEEEEEECDEKQQQQQKNSSNGGSVAFYKLFSFADPLDYVLMFFGTVGACGHGAAIPVFFIFFGKLIDSFGSRSNDPDKMASEVAKHALQFVYLGLVIMASGWIEVSCWMQTGERQSDRMRMHYLKSMLSQDVSFFDTSASTGEIISCISSDVVLVQDVICDKVGHYLHYMARFITGFAVGFSSVWQLTLLTVAVVPLMAIAGGTYAAITTGLSKKSQVAYAEAGKVAEEAISQVRAVYSFVGETKAIQAYSRALENSLNLGKKGGFAKGLGVGFTYGLMFGAWALLLWYAGILVRHGVTNGGEAFTTILNVIISGISLGQAAPNLAAFSKGKTAAYNIITMIKRKPAMSQILLEGKTLPHVDGNIELHQVCFSYPSRPDIVFQEFCLSIPAGKTVAIVGHSGSGKSTIISLIERFYDPTAGEVLLDGHDVRSLQLKWLRGQIGLVSQEPALFATSIIENILYGKENASMEEIMEAAKAANAHSFIENLPDGYNTQVGERGTQLSGGQKQRVAIARAMLKSPKVLLLDEATSALDAESERIVQEALDYIMIGRTTVIVAHRLSTIRNADTIAVVQDGKIVESGSHKELMSKGKDGVYTSLVRLQETTASKATHEGLESSRQSRQSIESSSSLKSFSLGVNSTTSDSMDCENGDIEVSKLQEPLSSLRPSIVRLLKLNKPEWPFAVLGTLGAIMAGVETPLFALAISQVLITFYSPDKLHMKHEVQKIALIFSGAAVATVPIYLLQHYFYTLMGERLTMRIREMMFSAILRNEIGWFDASENSSGLLTSRLAADATLVRGTIADRMSTIAQNVALSVTAFVIAFMLDWRVTLVILATFPLLIGASVGEHLFLKGFGGDLNMAYSKASMVAGEAVSNIRTVVAFCAEERVINLFARELVEPKKKNILRGQIAGLGYGTSQLCMFGSYGLALWYASLLVKKGEADFGRIMKAFMVLIITAFGVAETLALAPDIVKGSQVLGPVFRILDRKTKIEPDDPTAEEVTQVIGDIEMRHVKFNYPARPDITIFEDLSLQIQAGTSLALVGPSGSGKSSVVALLIRFYDPTSGAVLIDGKDIRKLKLRSLRQHIALVQQEPALFATTIYENIRYGKDEASEAEVMEAAKAANAHSFISSLPDGYQTDVGERGMQLSGGQKQRVAIARAILKDPAILLLDEATSALDAASEKVVQAALDELMRGRTSVVVAHRLSTVQKADTIAVLHDGKVKEQGNPLQLISRPDSDYAQLVRLQQWTRPEM